MKPLHTRRLAHACGSLTLLLALGLAACGGGCGASMHAPPADTIAPAEWGASAVRTVLYAEAATPGGVSPIEESHAFAVAFSAAHDALNPIDRRCTPNLSALRSPAAHGDFATATAVSTGLQGILLSACGAAGCGLDTNVLVRDVMQNDPKQSARAARLIEGLASERPGFLSRGAIVELVCVLSSSQGLRSPERCTQRRAYKDAFVGTATCAGTNPMA
jgi:hypothetical protein